MIVVLGVLFGFATLVGAVCWLIWVCVTDTPEPRERPHTVADFLERKRRDEN